MVKRIRAIIAARWQNRIKRRRKIVLWKKTGSKWVTGSCAPLSWFFIYFFLIVGKTACYPFVQSTLSIYLSFLTDRQSTLCLARVIHPPPKKQTKKTPIQTQAMQHTHRVFVHRLQSFCQTKHINCLGESKRTSNSFSPQPSLCPSRIFNIKVSYQSTPSMETSTHPQYLNLQSPCWRVGPSF